MAFTFVFFFFCFSHRVPAGHDRLAIRQTYLLTAILGLDLCEEIPPHSPTFRRSGVFYMTSIYCIICVHAIFDEGVPADDIILKGIRRTRAVDEEERDHFVSIVMSCVYPVGGGAGFGRAACRFLEADAGVMVRRTRKPTFTMPV
ncbi:hypothetical protein GGS21DRAFT_509297 [Xylaria nigripes]|nr:hypothetical protein GGS21DRAFT_509297 [Xylaria nigripes]